MWREKHIQTLSSGLKRKRTVKVEAVLFSVDKMGSRR
jgi:hypothetical protein